MNLITEPTLCEAIACAHGTTRSASLDSAAETLIDADRDTEWLPHTRPIVKAVDVVDKSAPINSQMLGDRCPNSQRKRRGRRKRLLLNRHEWQARWQVI